MLQSSASRRASAPRLDGRGQGLAAASSGTAVNRALRSQQLTAHTAAAGTHSTSASHSSSSSRLGLANKRGSASSLSSVGLTAVACARVAGRPSVASGVASGSALVAADGVDASASLSRRWLLQTLLAGSTLSSLVLPDVAAAAAAGPSLLSRLDAGGSISAQSTPLFTRAAVLEYPRWLFGEWHVTSTFTSFRAPLGKAFVEPALLKAAEAPVEQGGIGSSIKYDVCFYSTLPDTFDNQLRMQLGLMPHDAVVQDRAFNTAAMADALAGYPAIESVKYDAREAPDRETVEYRRQGPDGRTLPPKTVQLFINSTRSEGTAAGAAAPAKEEDGHAGQPGVDGAAVRPPDERFVTSEVDRQVLLAVRKVSVTDYEVLTEFRRTAEPGVVRGRQRTCVYLDPRAPKFFEAASRTVAVYDHEFEMQRVPPPADAFGAEACVLTPKGYTQCQ